MFAWHRLMFARHGLMFAWHGLGSHASCSMQEMDERSRKTKIDEVLQKHFSELKRDLNPGNYVLDHMFSKGIISLRDKKCIKHDTGRNEDRDPEDQVRASRFCLPFPCVCLSIWLSVCLYVYIYTCQGEHACVCVCLCVCVCVSVYVSVCVFVCMWFGGGGGEGGVRLFVFVCMKLRYNDALILLVQNYSRSEHLQ